MTSTPVRPAPVRPAPVRPAPVRGASRVVAGLGAGAVALVSLAWVSTTGAVAATVCTPTVAQPTLDVEPGPVAPGGTVRVTGAGWCNALDGGSRVAIKLDEGAYSHPTAALHPNRTIWALVDADPADGTFAYDLQLPDGTLGTSEPVFTAGTHSLRALTGSLKEGDPVRTVRSTGDFVVGEHRPSGVPEPVDAAELTAAAGRAVTAKLSGARLRLDVAEGEKGDWVFLSVLAADGSPRYPWRDTWHRLGAEGRLTVDVGTEPPTGAVRVVVQDGNPGHVGDLLGWARVTFPSTTDEARKPTTRPTKRTPTSPRATARPTPVPAPAVRWPVPLAAVPRVAAPTLPATAPTAGSEPVKAVAAAQPPASPIRRWSGFWEADELPSALDGSELVVSAGATRRVHVHVHDATSSVAGGWVASDEDGRVRLDVGALPPGSYRFALQQGDDDYLGWAAVEIASDGEPVADRAGGVGGLVAAAARGDGAWSGTDAWLAGMGAVLLAGVGLGSAARRKVEA